MNKMMMIAAACAAALSITGCKSIEVGRHPQSLATVANADGTVSVVCDSANNPIVLDGGWEVAYFQHWNWQRFDSFSAKAGKDVSLDINNYESGADSNLVSLVNTSLEGATKLIATAAEAYVKVAGGGAQADVALETGRKIYDFFTAKGGDASKATVTTDTASNTVKVTDGATTVQCDASGNCTDCTDGSCTVK